MDWYAHITRTVAEWDPDMLAFEQVQSARNMNTVRALARFEAAAIIAGKHHGALVIPVAVSSARKVVFGQGNIPKEDAFAEMKKRYAEFPWLAKTRGGLDQSDAAVIALAGPAVLERR